MSYWRKLLEVLIQTALLPVSAIITGLSGLLFLPPLMVCGYQLETSIILGLIKGYDPEATYYVAPSDSLSVKEVSSGEYKVEVKHDNGKRYKMGFGKGFGIWILGLFALPLRVITLALSILALIILPLKINATSDDGFWGIVFDIYFE